MLYLYLASNANNYTLALSPVAVQEAIGMARSTYRDQFVKLVNKGYLVNTHGNTYEFYEVPQARPTSQYKNTNTSVANDWSDAVITNTNAVKDVQSKNIEINNTDILENNDINISESNPNIIQRAEPRVIEIPRPTVNTKEREKLRSLRESLEKVHKGKFDF